MRKILFKYLLLTALVIFLFLASTSCNGVVTPETGIVTITIDENMIMGKMVLPIYYIYMDDVYQGTSIDLEPLTLDAVPVGVHTFTANNYSLVKDSVNLKYQDNLQKELAERITRPLSCYGSATYEIMTGINYVIIPVYCGSVIY